MNKTIKLLMTATAISFLIATVAPVPTVWVSEVSAKDKQEKKRSKKQNKSSKKSSSSKKSKAREPEKKSSKSEQPRASRDKSRKGNVKRSANEKSARKGYMKRRVMKESGQTKPPKAQEQNRKNASVRQKDVKNTAKLRGNTSARSPERIKPKSMPWRSARQTEKVKGGSSKPRLNANRTRQRSQEKTPGATSERKMASYQYANVNRKAGNSRHSYKQVEPRRITRPRPVARGVDRTVTRDSKLDRREDRLDRREDRLDRRKDRLEDREDRMRQRRYDRAHYYHGMHWGIYSHYYDHPLYWYHGLPRYSYWGHSTHYWGGRMIYRPSVLFMMDSYWYGYPIGNGHHYDCDYGYNYEGAHYHPYGAPVHSVHEKIHDDDFAEEILAGVIGGLIIYSIID